MAASPGLPRSPASSRASKRPIAYDAVDNQPVDLVFLLLAPEARARII